MARYSDTVVDSNDVPLPGALVLVQSQVDGSLATLTTLAGDPLLNPITTDPVGSFEFFTNDGIYDLTYSYRGRIVRQRYGVNVGSPPVDPSISQAISSAIAGLSTSVISEGTNQYFTTARARAAFSGSATVTLNSGVVSLTKANVDTALGFTTAAISGSSTVTAVAGVLTITKTNLDTAAGFTIYPAAGSPTATVNSGVVSITSANIAVALGAPAISTAGGTLTGPLILPSNPTDPLGAATKQYVDNLSAGRQPKAAVSAASVANLTLNGTQTVDGVVLSVGNRFLAKDQTDQTKNGIWIVQSAAWTRASDMDAWAEVPNATCVVTGGTANANTSWICNSQVGGTLETTPITFVLDNAQPNYTATGGVTKTSLQFSLSPVATATFLGNTSGSTAAPTAQTVSSVKIALAISNVDNTSDANKPVSTAQATAIALKANAANPAFTGAMTTGRSIALSGAGAGSIIAIGANAGTQRAIAFQSGGLSRWLVEANSEAESGANVGSTFAISRLNDAGSYIDTPFSINRASGAISIGRTLALSGGAATTAVVMSGNSGAQKSLAFATAGALRWSIDSTNEAESTGDAGSNLSIGRFNDAGGYIDTPFSIQRNNGKMTSGANTSWISSAFSNILGIAQFQAVSKDGATAVSAFTRASDGQVAFGQGTYAVGAFGWADDTDFDSPDTYAIYAEGRRESGSATISTVEFAMRNNGSTVLCSPYQAGGRGISVNLSLSVLNNNHVSAAMLIYGGLSDSGGEPLGAQFQRGIVCKHGSITTGIVLDMAAEHRLLWGNAGTALSEINATQIGTSTYKFQEVWAVKYGIGGVLKTLSVDGSGFVKAA